jgi:hypothetical protein
MQMLTGSKLIAAFGDLDTALVMYDTETVLVKSAPGAECVTVNEARITYSRFVFDRAPFDAARKNGGGRGKQMREGTARWYARRLRKMWPILPACHEVRSRWS